MIILNGKKVEHLNMLEGGIIHKLLEEKWQSFARAEFMKKLVIMGMHLFLVSMAIYLRPHVSKPESDEYRITRYVFESVTILSCLYYIILQTGNEMRNQGVFPFLRQLSHDPVQLLFNLSNVLIVLCVPLRLLHIHQYEELFLAIAVPGVWFYLMFFAGAVRLTGPFVTMIFKIITHDMVSFFVIYTIFLLAFAQVFFSLNKQNSSGNGNRFDSYPHTWIALFQMTLGDYDYSELTNSYNATLMLMTFVLFMILLPILLLNMLIAMMGNTYATVVQESEKEWLKQLPGDGNRRGVMIIKTKRKTRARQRKGAISNWKHVGKTTKRVLKRRKMTGEQLRQEMWNLNSIESSPLASRKSKKNPIQTSSGTVTDFISGLAVKNFCAETDKNLWSKVPESCVQKPFIDAAPIAKNLMEERKGRFSLWKVKNMRKRRVGNVDTDSVDVRHSTEMEKPSEGKISSTRR